MKPVTCLRDIGMGKKCLIIGRGPSVGKLAYMKFNLSDYYVIFLNDFMVHVHGWENVTPDMIIYFDDDIKDYLNSKKGLIKDETLVVGYKHRNVDRCFDRVNFYYTHNDITFGDTGFHALQFADNVFNFSDIFLLGYDYTLSGKSYHYNELESVEDKRERFLQHSILVVQEYYLFPWKNNIYNVNEKSVLKAFEHKEL